LHSVGVVHRDLKPENFLTGRRARAHHLYLTDFGAVEPYHSGRAHLPQEDVQVFDGSFRYAPVTAHELRSQSRRDDLEAAGYMLVFLAKGTLPWAGVKESDWISRNQRILTMKKASEPHVLASGLHSCFADYLAYCQSLGYKERPNYTSLRHKFQCGRESCKPVGSTGQHKDFGWLPSSPMSIDPVTFSTDVLQPEDKAVGRKFIRRVTVAASTFTGARFSASESWSSSDFESASDDETTATSLRSRIVRNKSFGTMGSLLSRRRDRFRSSVAEAASESGDETMTSVSRSKSLASMGSLLSRSRQHCRTSSRAEQDSKPVVPAADVTTQGWQAASEAPVPRPGFATLLCGKNMRLTAPEIGETSDKLPLQRPRVVSFTCS